MVDEHFYRLLWALPLVIAIGCAALFALKRLGVGGAATKPAQAQPTVVSRTALSEHTQALVVEFNQQQFVVFESTAHLNVQPLSPSARSAAPVWPGLANYSK